MAFSWAAIAVLLASLSYIVAVNGAANSTSGSLNAKAPAKVDNGDPYKWIKIHGWLMWASFGFLIPTGTLVIRFTRCARRSKILGDKGAEMLFYAHITIQSIALVISVGGSVISFRNFSNQFFHTHQRLGLALWAVTWLQPFLGLVRPKRGGFRRPIWFIIHWLFGTGSIILSFYNVYNGLRIYELITGKSLKKLNITFSIQLSLMVVCYLLQDKWSYLKEQSKHSKVLPTATAMVRQYSVPSQRKHYTSA